MTNVNLSSGLPDTVLPDPPAEAAAALSDAGTAPEGGAAVLARWPRFLAGWATLGELAAAAGSDVEAYAYFRVGYHRGLDALRAAGWGGSGYVPWGPQSTTGFPGGLGEMGA